ncbi:SGNH/GDSL hydrolase family protein [Winogradskyella rapida]|uniref:SGNH/GDSL hydrolase family protein n=1 Tax=Winogradskyella rapida TaxID=549701 RepID=A0ABW3KVA9_9FLAO
MKNIRYILLSAIFIGFTACNSEEDFEDLLDNPTTPVELPALTPGSVDFSTYIAVGASFTGGFTDNALFIAGQQNSFPNLLSEKFALVGGGSFTQPLMNDNIGGFVLGSTVILSPRLYFDGSGPAELPATPTTEITDVLSGPFNNYGITGAKSFHLGIPGYGTLNPYFGRMASTPTATIIGDAAAQNPTFFTLSEIGGNDVLAYALSGGTGEDQTGNLDAASYANNDLTDPNVFAASFSASVDALTANGAKGVVANLPYITSLAHFTTVPHNPLDPSNPAFGPQIPLLNSIFGALNPIFNAVDPDRAIVFSETEASAVVIKDENLTDISSIIIETLNASPTFPAFIAQFGLPPQAAPLVANLLGNTYGQTRQATEADLLVLPSSSVIGTVNEDYAAALELQGLSATLAAQFAAEGITLPLEDKWVLIPSEQSAIKTVTDAYNVTIASVASDNGLAFVDFNAILAEASTTGYPSGDFILTTDLVTGGLVSLDGVHLTSRGYAVMANEMLKAIDITYGSNFEASGNLIVPGNYPTNFPPSLQ